MKSFRRASLCVPHRLARLRLRGQAVLLLACFGAMSAQTEIWTKITATPGAASLPIVVADFGIAERSSTDLAEAARTIHDVLVRDLDNSLFFQLRMPETGKVIGSTASAVDFPGWAATGATILVAADLSRTTFTLRVYDLLSKRLVVAKDYAHPDNPRALGHRLADEIIQLLTGEEGVASSRIAFSRRVGKGRELFTVDQDGLNLQQVTDDGNIKLSPDWSSDGDHLAYSSYTSNRLAIFSLSLRSRKTSVICDRADMNDAPAWSPDGKLIAASLSTDKGQEIFVLDPANGHTQQVTYNYCIGTSPAWSPNGKQIIFVSDRAGSPQIYVVNADGTDQHRLTFEGSYNTTPAWSPRGDVIAYSRRDGGVNQIWITDLEGASSRQLTFSGNNVEPCFSSDGLHIAYISNRTSADDIYVMNWDGTNQRRLTTIGGCSSPSWSPPLH